MHAGLAAEHAALEIDREAEWQETSTDTSEGSRRGPALRENAAQELIMNAAILQQHMKQRMMLVHTALALF
eukprot:1152091-Pelagomonas_calceolata.AAC.10